VFGSDGVRFNTEVLIAVGGKVIKLEYIGILGKWQDQTQYLQDPEPTSILAFREVVRRVGEQF
jgi:hypothetical protein